MAKKNKLPRTNVIMWCDIEIREPDEDVDVLFYDEDVDKICHGYVQELQDCTPAFYDYDDKRIKNVRYWMYVCEIVPPELKKRWVL